MNSFTYCYIFIVVFLDNVVRRHLCDLSGACLYIRYCNSLPLLLCATLCLCLLLAKLLHVHVALEHCVVGCHVN